MSILAAWMIGPRIGKFPSKYDSGIAEIKGHSVPVGLKVALLLIFLFLVCCSRWIHTHVWLSSF